MSILDELLALRARGGFLADLSEEDVAGLSAVLRGAHGDEGDVVIRPGEPGDRVYLVLEGRLTIEPGADTDRPLLREEVGPGELMGATAFSTGGVHENEVRCLEACRLAMLSRDGFDRLLEKAPETWQKLHELALEQMRRHHLATHLDRLFGPFGTLLPYILQELEEEVEWLTLPSGETLYRAGDAAENAFILITGQLLVATETADGEEKVISTILAGETVGEVGLLTEHDRSTTVFAGRDSELIRLSRHSFELMLERSSRAMFKVSRLLVHRLAHRTYEPGAGRTPIRCIGVVPAHPSVDLDQLCRVLQESLAAQGPVDLLSSQTVDRELGMPGISQAEESEPAHLRLVQWLHEREGACRYLIYQADPTWTRWSERCARQADRLAAVADGTATPDLGEIESHLAKPRQRWSLVLIHPAELDQPLGTAQWLHGSSAQSVYHVRRGNTQDLARLVRIHSGRAVGVVFGGGGARGFAHLGVLRALEELGVPIDMIGGTSIGAPIAGFTAQGYDAAEAQAIVARDFRSLLDYTLPVASLLAGQRITDTIEHHALSWDIEDLWLPYFCVSTNLTTSRSQVHRHGSLARAVRASVAIPGVLPPVPENGELLVDGGVLNNLPIDVMREMNPFGPVIAIDVVAPQGPSAKADYGLAVSGWGLALERGNPWKKARPIPGIATTIIQSMIVGAGLARDQALRQNLADLYLNIHVRGVGMLEFDKVEQVAQIGYEQSVGPIREWVESGALQ
jgi:predicted acylesterase/phospholipase RssA/CRP-like cAMP-binding protein